MKVIKRLKKGLFSIGIAIISFPTKIFAALAPDPDGLPPDILYGPPPVAYRPSPVTIIWRIARTFVIPIALLIGIIVYFKKSKSSTKKKILVTLGIIALTALIYFIINKIIYELDLY